MWLIRSSIGRKLVMSISGVALVLFLLFHLSMNVAAVLSAEAYNMICSLLGANWYAVAATMLLAGLIALHFCYALLLTLQNRKARGADRYAVGARPKGVSWASQNMFVIGLIICGGLLLHLSQFWYNMMFTELLGHEEATLCGGKTISTTDGAAFIAYYFSHTWVVIAYLVWYGALWFHLTHGVWSAIQTIGWSNEIWLNRWKAIGNITATLIFLGFAGVTLFFYLKSFCAGGACLLNH
ncbi:MAG: succinate dehydrogenase cytochrome b subunit [Tannerella sp.]|jgi:succinate dehydrogenase / fumarate reductase cytochrome b subunit|nr:succinate dehydrogenase cytochrome b subunit [Tannerella sp.]